GEGSHGHQRWLRGSGQQPGYRIGRRRGAVGGNRRGAGGAGAEAGHRPPAGLVGRKRPRAGAGGLLPGPSTPPGGQNAAAQRPGKADRWRESIKATGGPFPGHKRTAITKGFGEAVLPSPFFASRSGIGDASLWRSVSFEIGGVAG